MTNVHRKIRLVVLETAGQTLKGNPAGSEAMRQGLRVLKRAGWRVVG
jgi:hypothetical protein